MEDERAFGQGRLEIAAVGRNLGDGVLDERARIRSYESDFLISFAKAGT